MKRIGITGSRTRNTDMDFEALKAIFFKIYEKGDIIVSGGASRGADHFAKIIADRSNGKIEYVPIEPKYEVYGDRAPLVRNKRIAEQTDILIAMPNPDSRTQGTSHTIVEFLKVHNNDESLVYFV
jgi:hypothetical protein